MSRAVLFGADRANGRELWRLALVGQSGNAWGIGTKTLRMACYYLLQIWISQEWT